MNTSGHIKDQESDENGNRIFIVSCLGNSDQRKYFSLSPFGIDFNPPEDTRSLTTSSQNNDTKYNLGVLNKIKIEDLAKGESAIFSTNEAGEELKSQIIMRNTGKIEIITTSDIDINSDANINIVAADNVAITATQLDVNGGNLTVD